MLHYVGRGIVSWMSKRYCCWELYKSQYHLLIWHSKHLQSFINVHVSALLSTYEFNHAKSSDCIFQRDDQAEATKKLYCQYLVEMFYEEAKK